MSLDPFIREVCERPINGRYALSQKLGAGGFGVVYLGTTSALHFWSGLSDWEQPKISKTDREVALKLEHHSAEHSFLKDEVTTYETIRGAVGIPEVYWFGQHDDFRVMAVELLGPSLEDLFAYCGRRFSLKTTLMIFDQLLQRVEMLHSNGIVHRDIKPRNFLLGTGAHGNRVYVTDFGLADESARPDADLPVKEPPQSHLIGTARFASIRGHQGIPQGPQDDLESLGYMMVYFLKRMLPWQGLGGQGKRETQRLVMEKKMATSAEELCNRLPPEFTNYMRTVRLIRPGDDLNYRKLRVSFQQLAERHYAKYENVFDWTIELGLKSNGAKIR